MNRGYIWKIAVKKLDKLEPALMTRAERLVVLGDMTKLEDKHWVELEEVYGEAGDDRIVILETNDVNREVVRAILLVKGFTISYGPNYKGARAVVLNIDALEKEELELLDIPFILTQSPLDECRISDEINLRIGKP